MLVSSGRTMSWSRTPSWPVFSLEAGSEGGKLDWMAVGIGLNLAEAPALDRPTTCIGPDVPVETALERVVESRAAALPAMAGRRFRGHAR